MLHFLSWKRKTSCQREAVGNWSSEKEVAVVSWTYLCRLVKSSSFDLCQISALLGGKFDFLSVQAPCPLKQSIPFLSNLLSFGRPKEHHSWLTALFAASSSVSPTFTCLSRASKDLSDYLPLFNFLDAYLSLSGGHHCSVIKCCKPPTIWYYVFIVSTFNSFHLTQTKKGYRADLNFVYRWTGSLNKIYLIPKRGWRNQDKGHPCLKRFFLPSLIHMLSGNYWVIKIFRHTFVSLVEDSWKEDSHPDVGWLHR